MSERNLYATLLNPELVKRTKTLAVNLEMDDNMIIENALSLYLSLYKEDNLIMVVEDIPESELGVNLRDIILKDYDRRKVKINPNSELDII